MRKINNIQKIYYYSKNRGISMVLNETFSFSSNPVTTASITVITGVIVIVIGQIFIKFFIEPIQKQYKIIGKITNSMIYYFELLYGNKFYAIADQPPS